MDYKEAKIRDFLQELAKAWPYKRIVIPKHLLKRWDEERGDGMVTKEMALTVDKDFDISDDEQLWELMLKLRESTKNAKPLRFNDLKLRESKPPKTGVEKTKLI